jgi:hypothetical protein
MSFSFARQNLSSIAHAGDLEIHRPCRDPRRPIAGHEDRPGACAARIGKLAAGDPDPEPSTTRRYLGCEVAP